MNHDSHSHNDDKASARRIGWAFWLNLIFACAELAGGLYIQSLAVISDALHDFGDALGLGVGYVLQSQSSRGPTESYSYGMRRLSLLSALITGTVITSGALYVLVRSILSFQEPHEPQAEGMMIFAVIGIAVNGFAAWKLGGHAHAHGGHGHAHEHSHHGHSHGHNHNETMIRWHLIEDVLGWVAVLIGAIGIYFLGWSWLDPLLAVAISLFVLYNVVPRLRETLTLFLQGNPNPPALRHFREHVTGMKEVKSLHDVHFWSLDGVRHVLSLHVVLHDVANAAQVKDKIRQFSRELGNCHMTIEVESPFDHCHDDCEHP